MRPSLVVLCYHGVSESWPDETAVAPGDLSDHVEAFLRRGYRGVTFSEALTTPSHPRLLAVTFDDAADSVYELGAPILDAHGVPGTVFAPTDFAGADAPMSWSGLDGWLGTEYESELGCMSWTRLAELADGGWEVGSHTCSHPHLASLADADLRRELLESKRECERHLDRPCLSLAYPYSDVDARVAHAARAAGYLTAATVPLAAASPLPLLWPRVGVYRGEGPGRVRLRARRRSLGLVPGVEPVLSVAARTGRMITGR